MPDGDEFDLFRLSERVGDGKGFFPGDVKNKFGFFILKASNEQV